MGHGPAYSYFVRCSFGLWCPKEIGTGLGGAILVSPLLLVTGQVQMVGARKANIQFRSTLVTHLIFVVSNLNVSPYLPFLFLNSGTSSSGISLPLYLDSMCLEMMLIGFSSLAVRKRDG